MTYQDLINIRYKKPVTIFIITILFLGVLIFILNQKISDVYNTYGYFVNDELNIRIPLDYPDTISKIEGMKINDEKIKYEILNIGDVLLDENSLTNYQIVTFKTSKSYKENQVMVVTIYFNKEKVLEKLRKLIF